ncbi:MAG TPA: MTH938/NDUFAF3 family protein [Thiolinea sp.]|nr:MTH938/NDUFAF3 family protein [Thiolinea sp.]
MKFSEDFGNTQYRIREYGPGWIRVNEQRLTHPFILSPEQLVPDWLPATLDQLQPVHLKPLLDYGAEIILIGTGPQHRQPPAAAWQTLIQGGSGFELMETGAACRTLSVLLSENRRTIAALFP